MNGSIHTWMDWLIQSHVANASSKAFTLYDVIRLLTSCSSSGMQSYMYCTGPCSHWLTRPNVIHVHKHSCYCLVCWIMHKGMQATLQHQHLKNREMHPLQLFIRGKVFCDIRSVYLVCVVGCCNTPCTSEGPQCRPHAFTCQTLTRKSTTAPLNPYHAFPLLIRSPVNVMKCVCGGVHWWSRVQLTLRTVSYFGGEYSRCR